MRALVASVALSVLVLAGCGDDDASGGGGPAPRAAPLVELDPDALTVEHPCGRGFQVGTLDQEAALLFRPSDGDPAAGRHHLPGGAWTGTVRLGRHLFVNWCDDVQEAHEPDAETLEEWPVVEGTVEVVLPDDGFGPATLTATDLVAERPDGERVEIGDLTIENPNHGLVPG